MKIKKSKIELMIRDVEALIHHVMEAEQRYGTYLDAVHPAYEKSARNLVHYRALREKDITALQKKLGALGLSRLARAEAHVLASLKTIRSLLKGIATDEPMKSVSTFLSIKKGRKLVRTHAKDLLGYRSKGRRVRIMVTQPVHAATDEHLIDDLVQSGMNCARINCAHDGPAVWEQMVERIREACTKHRRSVNICMDLGGPKIRTGSMRPGPQVTTFAPERDSLGHVIGPAVLHLVPEWPTELGEAHPIPLPATALDTLHPGDRFVFSDTRGKERHLRVIRPEEDGWIAYCYDRAYIETGMKLYREKEDQEAGAENGLAVEVGYIPPVEEKIILHEGNTLILHRDPRDGEPAAYDEDGNLLQTAHISCTAPELFDLVQVGERILFDDGKIVGRVEQVIPGEEMHVLVIYAREGGQKLKADKGINVPDSNLQLQGLTEKDRRDLAFVASHADVVNMSFVNTKEDVEDLLGALDELGALGKLGIILKIETQRGFDNLTEIMLTAMQTYPIGVMIARGDLAVEVGWEHMPRIQEEILSLCLAAHMPDVWATQVLESLAKKGLPSRAEITDAARAQRAECVMLNKGPYITNAIHLLDRIFADMSDHVDKNVVMMPAIKSS